MSLKSANQCFGLTTQRLHNLHGQWILVKVHFTGNLMFIMTSQGLMTSHGLMTSQGLMISQVEIMTSQELMITSQEL